MAGRPRSFDREHALLLAQHAFWRNGYDATSIAELTEAIGINPPSLYAAFGNKDRLFCEAAARYVERFRTGLDEALEAPTAGEAVADLLNLTAHAHTDPDTPPGCLVLSDAHLGDERRRMRSVIAARIARGRAAGDVAPEIDPDRVAGYVEVVMTGMSARARDGATFEELAATAEIAARAIAVDLVG